MVKGISKRVIVVHAPDPRFFEQAVFFLRDEALSREGVSADQILAEAGSVAACYLRKHPAKMRRWLPPAPALWMGLGAALTGLVWGLTAIIASL